MEKKVQAINSIWWHTWTHNSRQEPGLSEEEKHETNLQCDTVAQHAGWLMPAHTEFSSRARGDALPIPKRGTPHHHRPPPPSGPWAEVGPLLTAWTSACLHHLPTGAGQGRAQKSTRYVGASGFSGNRRWVRSSQQAQPVSSNLRGCGISINKNCRRQLHTTSMKTPRRHQTHAILALQC